MSPADSASNFRMFPCPGCREELLASMEDMGKTVRCPLCDVSFPLAPRPDMKEVSTEKINDRRFERFDVKDGIVRLPWGPFNLPHIRFDLLDLSIGGARCRCVDLSIAQETIKMLQRLLKTQGVVPVLVNLPAFAEDLPFHAKLKRVQYNPQTRILIVAFQFQKASTETMERLQRLAHNPIIRTFVRNLSL